MTPTSTHSVTANGASGNTPQPEILSTLSQVAEMCAQADLIDGAQAIAQIMPLLTAELGQLRYYRRVMAIPSKHLGDGDKLVLMDIAGEVRYRRSQGETGPFPIYCEGRAHNTGKSAKTFGKSIKRIDRYGALHRREERTEDGHTRILIEPTELFDTPWEIIPQEERNHGGKRTPKCQLCGSEHFKPVAWECKGCGVTYDELPYPDEPDTDPEPPDPSGQCPPPPTDNLSDMVNPQWGGTPQDNLSVGPSGFDDTEVVETQKGGDIADGGPEGQLVARVEGGAGDLSSGIDVELLGSEGDGVVGQESETYPQACSETSTHGAAAPKEVQQEDDLEASLTPEDNLSVGVPQELRGHSQWVAWRPETTPDGRCVKPPYRPSNPRKRADVMDPATWGTYEEALSASGEGGGVGFVLTGGDPYSVIDLDGCRDPETGQIEPAVAEVVRLLDSYTEISPSGKGLHVWVRGRIPGDRRRKGGLEMYDQARYVTVTGHVLGGRAEIRERQEELGELYRRTFGDTSGQPRRPRGPEQSPRAGDEEIIARVLADPEGQRLWAGDTSLHNNDPSRADLALLNRLARYTGDPERLDRLFRKSGLYRPKWERRDYRERTLARALSGRPPERDGGTPTVDGSVLSDVQGFQEGQ